MPRNNDAGLLFRNGRSFKIFVTSLKIQNLDPKSTHFSDFVTEDQKTPIATVIAACAPLSTPRAAPGLFVPCSGTTTFQCIVCKLCVASIFNTMVMKYRISGKLITNNTLPLNLISYLYFSNIFN